jgi:type IV pilus assembly protein PilY1
MLVMNTKRVIEKGGHLARTRRRYGACLSRKSLFSLAGLVLLSFLPTLATATTPTLNISQVPLKLAIPAHPQVLFAIGNSESMDGTLSGAIMVGSGMQPSALSSLQNSSSPINYTIPTGFVPPLNAGSGGQAPYTVTQSGGKLADNGPSRLNMAKAGIQAILTAYMQNTDFALETYSTSGNSLYATWVYYMSPPGSNFVFTNTPISGNVYIANPCYNYLSASATVKSNCTSLTNLYSSATLSTNQYMQIGASSDDPTINDILYAGGQPGIFTSYNGPQPATPYPPNFSLASYNNTSVVIRYNNTSPNIGRFGTGPTNAGFVPYSNQVMYAARGFGYGGNQAAAQGTVVVPMTSAGTIPTASSVNTAISKFTPFLQPETNNISTTEIKSIAGQAPTAGLLKTAQTYLSGLPSTGCNPLHFVILISDGLPTQDLSGKIWPPLGSAAAAGYSVTATFNPDGSLNTTNNQALTDAINTLTNLNNAGIKTYVIGMGAGVLPSVNPQAAATLTAMAIAGGTINYYPASSATALVTELNDIMISVQSGTFATTQAAVSSTNLQVGTVVYQASFTASADKYQDWTGNLTEQALDVNTGSPTGPILWSAKSLLDAQSSRLIATWNTTLNSGAGGGTPFEWANISASQQSQLQPSDTLGANRLQYLRGSTSLEIRNGGTFRNRSHLLGDIVDSTPIYVGPPANQGLFTLAGYTNFVKANTSRQGMLYVGANDGMLHAFNASNGAELFAFIPNGVFANLHNLTAQLYNQSHQFFVDGAPQSGDVTFSDNSWHTILVGGESAGGKSVYALDITNPTGNSSESTLANNVLWEFTDSDMGLSYSQPQIGLINNGSASSANFAVFFGNGYNSPNNNAVLYAVNPQTGSIIRKINLCTSVPSACDSSLPQGLSTVALGQVDGLQGQPITVVYAGDLQGNLWAINVSSSSPSAWTARVLLQARDSSGTPQPITTPPLVTLNPSYPKAQGLFVMFGTGALLTPTDLTSTQYMVCGITYPQLQQKLAATCNHKHCLWYRQLHQAYLKPS